ncbi:MAG: CCA tRNA nucleotidyltransferase [Dehalococcoidales bacterium]|nr:CCA tRNA nucleotidyltransferase [Dehalococcoidales bacterium]
MLPANLASRIEHQLPVKLVEIIHTAGRIANSQHQNLYLVGGAVRDLLLEKPNLDLDIVVEGNAIELARQLTEVEPSSIITYPQFNTAKITGNRWSLDLATARSESYPQPGALPTVTPSSIETDLFRRDFTINAMAICLNPDRYGELIDRYRGQDDLKDKLIRVLHDNSFVDDATRIWRGLRYEQRLGFQLEANTLKLLLRDIPMLDTISKERIRYELECIFSEEQPEKVLRRADELGVLTKLHPALTGNGWLAAKFMAARQLSIPNSPSFSLYLALLAYRLTPSQCEILTLSLGLAKSVAQTIRQSTTIKTRLEALTNPKLSPSDVYRQLHHYSATAIIANIIATDSPVAQQYMETFLHHLRYVKSILSGDDLIAMGVPQGPQIKQLLEQLHQAKLDGRVTTRQDEEKLVKKWLIS